MVKGNSQGFLMAATILPAYRFSVIITHDLRGVFHISYQSLDREIMVLLC